MNTKYVLQSTNGIYPVRSKFRHRFETAMRLVRASNGMSTLELLIAITILTLAASAAIMVAFGGQSVSLDIETNSEAITKATTQLETERALSRQDFNLVNPIATTTDAIYQKSITVQQIDLFTKKVTSNISWSTDPLRTQTVQLTTLLTNPQATNGGGTCSSVLVGDWKNPQMSAYAIGADLLVPNDPSSSFPVTNVDVFNHHLYVTVNNSHGNNGDITLLIFDITDQTIKPVYLTSSDNNPGVKEGLNAVRVAGNYAYVANGYRANFATCTNPTGANASCAQLQIIDVSVTPPLVKYSMKIPGVTGSGGQGIGQSIAYHNGYVYLGLAKATGPEFNVVDVHDPFDPIWKGGYEVGNGVNSIFIKGNYAYIASPNTENMTILNISNPLNPTRVGGYSPAGGNNGESVTAVGSTVYLGRTYGTNEFYILNATIPTSISLTASKDTGSGNNTSINGLMIRDYLAFFITDSQFQIWNIANPSSIFPWTPHSLTSEFLNLPGGSGTTLDCEGNYLYIGSLPSNDKGYVSVITSSP